MVGKPAPGHSMWDHFSSKIHFVVCEDDDEPQECTLCHEMKSAGKEFPVSLSENNYSQFICSACWMIVTMRMLQIPDEPATFEGSLVGELGVPDVS